MIFKSKLARSITRGKKWQTRRPVKLIPADDRTGEMVEAPCRYRQGSDYALQVGRGKPALDGIRIKIVAVRTERLGDLGEDDARAEGFKDTEEFFDYWRELYGEVNKAQRVHVITFDPVTEDRYLAARVGGGEPTGKADPFTGGRSTDYVHGPAGAAKDDAAGAVPEDFQEELTAQANERWDAYVAEERVDELAVQRARKCLEKMHRLQREAANLGVDITPALESAIAAAQGQIVDERRAA